MATLAASGKPLTRFTIDASVECFVLDIENIVRLDADHIKLREEYKFFEGSIGQIRGTKRKRFFF